jgi:ribosomal protection tetracycline resistance protein
MLRAASTRGVVRFTHLIRNVGLLAHVDAGKTTTTEQMLFRSGRIRTPGRVDAGTTQTDYLEVERRRGISVRMAATALEWKGATINLIDTPGHTDFVAEVERSLRILDGAVLIISAAEGVQAHTETLWHALRTLGVPTLLFVNKVDRFGASPERVLRQIRSRLTDRAVPAQALPTPEHDFQGAERVGAPALLEVLAEWDEPSLARYVDGDPGEGNPVDGNHSAEGWVHRRLAKLTQAGMAFPVLFGASLKGIGVAELMDAVVAYLPPPRTLPGAEPAGVIFKVEPDPVMGRMAYVRLFSGTLRTRAAIPVSGRPEPVRVVAMRKMYARTHQDVGELSAGDIAVVCGLGSVRAGDVIGVPEGLPPAHRLAAPVLRVRVWPEREQDLPRLLHAVQALADEDPSLLVHWVPEVRQIHVTVTGPVQVEVVQALLQHRHGLGARFSPPDVIYQEAPVGVGEGEAGSWLNPRSWVRLRVAPGEPGIGLVYVPLGRHDDLYPQFEAEVRRSVESTLQQGLAGWQVTDARVTLVAGRFCSISTTVGEYTDATAMAVMSALAAAGTRLLEPLYAFRLSVPEAAAGRVMAELLQMRAVFDPPVAEGGGRLVLDGTVPVATSLAFPARVSGLTGGRGIWSARPAGYQPAPPGTQAERSRTGVNPLDRNLYRLAIRGAVHA